MCYAKLRITLTFTLAKKWWKREEVMVLVVESTWHVTVRVWRLDLHSTLSKVLAGWHLLFSVALSYFRKFPLFSIYLLGCHFSLHVALFSVHDVLENTCWFMLILVAMSIIVPQYALIWLLPSLKLLSSYVLFSLQYPREMLISTTSLAPNFEMNASEVVISARNNRGDLLLSLTTLLASKWDSLAVFPGLDLKHFRQDARLSQRDHVETQPHEKQRKETKKKERIRGAERLNCFVQQKKWQ